MRPSSQLILSLFTLAHGCNCALYQHFQDVPKTSFDFVIIGGGTAGSVLANRLTENAGYQVLVIEDGPSNEGVLNSIIPINEALLLGSQFDWNFTTTPQRGLNGRTIPYARGHILGGSSSINDMFYTRGSSSDYDRWAAVTKDVGWSWSMLLPYILKMEKWTAPADNHNTTGQYDPSLHNFSGMTMVSLAGWPQGTDGRVLEAANELKGEFSFNLDMNSGNPLGLGWLQSTIGHGRRSSAATSYLATQFLNRQNLHVVLNTRVTRVLQTSGGMNTTPSFRTVEIAPTQRGARVQVTATKEVLLAAGSVGTPHILMHSGIGDPNELKKVGIIPFIDLPSVGKNLTDHALSSVTWSANSTMTFDTLQQNATLLAEAATLWNLTQSGPFTVQGGIGQVMWLRLPANSTGLKSFPDPASGPNSPHIELVVANGGSGTPGHYVGMGFNLVAPLSRGTISLSSNDPFDPPLIDPALLVSDFDILAMLQAVRSSQKFFTAQAWKGYILNLAPPFTEEDIIDDDFVIEVLRNNTINAWHPVGTAAMSAKGAVYGVVDPDLRVKKVTGLRIVDASIMPFIIAGHTQAPVYGIAERASDMIKASWA